jgi:hypothetical protein
MKYTFKDMLLSRHGENDTICVSAYKLVDGEFRMSEHFTNGVDQAAAMIERGYQRQDIGAIWTNIQQLKPGATNRQKHNIIAYTNILVDIDRRNKKDAAGNKINATDAERAVLKQAADQVAMFLAKQFGQPVFADSGNGYHLSWRCDAMPPTEGQDWYRQLLSVLRAKFEQPDVNMEIDLSLSDATQVVTVWGTWNRKYPHTADRPQRQSELLYLPTPHTINYSDIMVVVAENSAASDEPSELSSRSQNVDKRMADQDWSQDYGVGDLVDFFGDFIAYESNEFDKSGDIYHPIKPCYCHGDVPRDHSHPKDCCIIEWADGGLGISCFSRDYGLPTMIATLNRLKGEKYPHRIFEEEPQETFEELIADFGADILERDLPTLGDNGVCTNKNCESYRAAASKLCASCANPELKADITPDAKSPIGDVCYKTNCQCPLIHAQLEKPKELFEEEDKSYDLVHTLTKTGSSGLRVLRISDSPDRPIDWLWPNRIPAGNAFTMSGPIGCNKSMALLDIAARISNGADWPDGEINEFGAREVLICATEDELQTVIRPRLRAAGADLTKVLSLVTAFDVDTTGKRVSRTMDLEKDTQRLYEALIANPQILLVILDPLTGFYGNADPNDNRKIRQMVTKIAKMCMKTKTAVACIVHENKKSDANMVDKMMGASSLSQVIRAGMRFSFDPDKKPNGRNMASLKNSYGGRGGGMKFEVDQVDLISTNGRPLKNIGFVKWTEKHDQTADEVSQAQKLVEEESGGDNKIDVAVKIFQTELGQGRRLHKDIHPILDAAGISDETKRRARRKLGVVSSKQFPWYWWIPGKEYEPGSREQQTVDQEVI